MDTILLSLIFICGENREGGVEPRKGAVSGTEI